MNRKMIVHTVGRMVLLEAGILVLPLLVSALYRETCIWAFLLTILLAAVVGLPITLFCKPKNSLIYAKEGFVIVAMTWLAFSAIGALPFVFSGEIPAFADAFFETVSGLTTTGASILRDVERMSHGLLFWRSFTHWIGGMGVLVFIMAIVPDVSGRPMHILRAEMPGPVVGKLVPRIKDTAKILYLIYIAMTVLEIVLLLCGGMSLFDSVLHAFGTAGTGGFGIQADGLAGYNAYLQWVIAIFMLLFGVNFNLYYLLLIKRFRAVLHSSELMTYLVIALVAAGTITCNIYPLYHNVGEAMRQSVFQVASVITTTGYSTADFNLWPGLSKGILFLLMFIGGCAGSTAGGLKISRVMILMKNIRRQLRHMLHPRSVGTLRMEGKPLDEETVSGVSAYFALCMVCMAAVFLLISFEPFGTESNLTAAVACFNNIGPGLGAVGPAGNYAAYSAFSKYVLSAAMLLGRLEIYPLLLVCSPSAWVRNK